jgi:hypothetical protein
MLRTLQVQHSVHNFVKESIESEHGPWEVGKNRPLHFRQQ